MPVQALHAHTIFLHEAHRGAPAHADERVWPLSYKAVLQMKGSAHYCLRMSEMKRVYRSADVFVAGGVPDVTYNPRDDLQLEDEVRSYLRQTGRALSISGPTKSGKTVLVERFLSRRDAIWMHGSDLVNADAFWERVVDWMGLYDSLEVSTQVARQESSGLSGTLGVPRVASVTGSLGESETATGVKKVGRKRALSDVAREGLSTLPVPIVVDDFHYVPDDAKTPIARAIKSLLPVTRVVMIAVPHEAMEAVRAEPDMTGRVWDLTIQHWKRNELEFIAGAGFEVLNVQDTLVPALAERLAEASYGAPFLMQQLCLDLVEGRGNDVLETVGDPVHLVIPGSDWTGFLRRIANRSKPDVFDKLLKGPKTRGTARDIREFKSGVKTDIYGAVLRSIALTGRRTSIRYQDLFKILVEELVEAPRPQQITNALFYMAEIAEINRGVGDAAMAYKDEQIHVADPFLAFYLRYSGWFEDLNERSL